LEKITQAIIPQNIQQGALLVSVNFKEYLKKQFPCQINYILNGDVFIHIASNKCFNLMFFLNNHTQSQFKILSDICVLDFP
jgi:hypothetical protein